jgi:glycosyltransferase involved in cell wall biosynthesis
MRVHTLARIDSRPIGHNLGEIRAFMTVRNELLRLPSTLDHYRKIGVTRFFVVDNGSTDGSKEFLLVQPDCHIFVTHNSFSESLCGVEWQNTLLDQYGTNHWCLVADADEWFVYPGYESQLLPKLAAYLERSGAQGIFAFLLDMYGPGTIAESICEPERSLLDACRYFDTDYAWHRRPRIPGIESARFPEYDVFGGPRLRLLFPKIKSYFYIIRILWRTLDFVPFPLPEVLRTPPTLTKIPFVRWLPGTRYQHNHATLPIKLSDVTGALLHFKFLQDFYARVVDEVNRKEHWDGASEYGRYLAKLRQNPSLSFHYSGSAAYEGSEQLVRLGLLREDEEWRRIRTEIHESGTRRDQHNPALHSSSFPSGRAAAP